MPRTFCRLPPGSPLPSPAAPPAAWPWPKTNSRPLGQRRIALKPCRIHDEMRDWREPTARPITRNRATNWDGFGSDVMRIARNVAAAGVAAVLALTIGTTAPASAAVPESKDPIKIALFDWTSVNINAKILGGILQKLGYNVEYPTADYLSSLTTGLTNGDLTVGLEFWDTTAGEAMKASDATGQTERLGALGPKAKEEWWYPLYMKERCPGLPNWEALKNPECAEAFSTPETAPKGRYLGGPVTWEGFDDERVDALGLPFTVIHAGTD